MNKVTRVGCFETNSSSMHSISIAGATDVLDKMPIEGDVCKVYPGEFGWEIETYHSAAIKASYCLTYAMSGDFADKEKLLNMLKDVLKKATGKKVEFVSQDSEYYPWGYIDHQSEDVCGPAFASKKSLKNFIFNPKSWLKTDNDNH